MKYYIKGEGANAGKTAEADFRLIVWTGSEWIDQAEELEVNVRWGTEMTLKQYKDIIDYWQGEIDSGEIGDWDMSDEWDIDATDPDELVYE